MVRTLASLVEPRFAFWRVWSSYGSYFGEFGRAMVRILASLVEPKYPWPDMPPKRTKKVRLNICRTQIRPSDKHDIVAISGQ